ncbi:translational GTPase TypA [Patescibacteria group bacterium]
MKKIKNIAVIAHVDHGKTTLVDALLKQTKTFRENQEEMFSERILDSNDLERERGITILAKICSVVYQGTHINIIDTPGHADFSGEVERTLDMADGALLIVDAQEGPMPQTRFVLKKAMELNLAIVVLINKIDKKYARVKEVESRIGDLFLELAKDDSHLDYSILYAVGRNGTVFTSLPENPLESGSVTPLLNEILNKIPEPKTREGNTFKMLISALDYNAHLGRIVIGRIHQGEISIGDRVVILGENGTTHSVDKIMIADGLERKQLKNALSGQIIAISGIGDASIGDTLADTTNAQPLSATLVSEPTLHMTMGPNTSPFAGNEGKYTTSRQIGERLKRELENNVSLKVDWLDGGKFKLSGRGELHLSVLLETMRREGYEMEVGKPEVIVKDVDGVKSEPVEELSLMILSEYMGAINQEMGMRQSKLISMEPVSEREVEYIYHIPTRALIGLRGLLLTLTKGTAIFSSQVIGYEPLGRPISKTRKGALISSNTGKAVEYGLRNLKGRGISFINPGIDVYEGMIVGLNAKDEDIEMNICKEKHLTNHRSKSHDGITQLAPDTELSLEKSIEFLETDELLEITPLSLRLRKKHLTHIERKRADRPGSRN